MMLYELIAMFLMFLIIAGELHVIEQNVHGNINSKELDDSEGKELDVSEGSQA